jgi:mannose-1-phosphate guanylyltransferase/phosphomannomutase
MGCDVLSLNSYTDENRVTLTQDELNQALRNLSNLVKSSEADLGVLIDNAAERLFLLDDKGRQIPPQMTLVVFVKLLCDIGRRGSIAVPVSMSSQVEEIAAECGNPVIRTKVSRSELMKTSLSDNVIFAGAGSGGFIFPSFLPTYDAMASTAMLLDALAASEKSLSQYLDELPEIHLLSEEIPTSWEQKGTIMRRLLEEVDGARVQLIDGIKVFLDDSAWILILPDPDEPALHLICEAREDAAAARIIGDYSKKIMDIVSG